MFKLRQKCFYTQPSCQPIIHTYVHWVADMHFGSFVFRNIPTEKWDLISKVVEKMFSHKIWIDRDPNIDIVIRNKKAELTKKLFDEKGMTDKWILGMIE